MFEKLNALPQSTQRAQRKCWVKDTALSASSVVSRLKRVIDCELLGMRAMPRRFARSPLFSHPSSLTSRPSARRAISLIEILISMFVLLFGLMGVAAIFPVGNHYVQQGENFDLGAGIAQNAFEEMAARGMLRPGVWYYGNHSQLDTNGANVNALGDPFIATNLFNFPQPPVSDPRDSVGPGHAFVIDPMGSSDISILSNKRVSFPAAGSNLPAENSLNNPWADTALLHPLPGSVWPVRRITLPIPDPTPPATPPPGGVQPIAMTQQVGETIFRLRDDLAVEQPDESDQPSIQRWDVDTSGATPQLLRRQYDGNYSWLATIVPTNTQSLAALQPAHDAYSQNRYDVSVVVFRKREFTPSAESERLIEAELLQGRELVIYSTGANPRQEVDNALDDVRAGNWIALMGVNQTTGDFIMKWYRLLALDTKDETRQLTTPGAGTVIGRRAMLLGPEWPRTPSPGMPGRFLENVSNLRAAILPGAVSVVTKQLKMEDTSLWSLE